MFNRIAPTYDLLNSVLSVGQHQVWARRLIRRANPGSGEFWLDLATGSGPLIAEGLRYAPSSNWTGLDPSEGLLARAKRNPALEDVPLILGYGEELPFEDSHFDGITIAYGLRNYSDPQRGLAEMLRVLRPGGRIHVLEFHRARKEGGWGKLAPVRWYLEVVIPTIGKLVSGDNDAYNYLSRTAGGFWTRAEFKENLVHSGFVEIEQHDFMFGSVTLTIASRP